MMRVSTYRPTDSDFEVAILACGGDIRRVAEMDLDERSAWGWFVSRNPMRGWKGLQHLLAMRLAGEANKDLDVIWPYMDPDKMMSDNARRLKILKQAGLHNASQDEIAQYVKEYIARGGTW